MKNLIKLSILGALTMFSVAHAAEIDRVTVTPDSQDMSVQHRYAMQSSEFYKFKGGYELSNGMTLSVYSIGNEMYAQLNDQPRERIVATSHNSFSSTQSGLKMHILVQDADQVSGEVILPRNSAPANIGQINQRYSFVSGR